MSKGTTSLLIPEIQGHTGGPNRELSPVVHPQNRKGPLPKNGCSTAWAGSMYNCISLFISNNVPLEFGPTFPRINSTDQQILGLVSLTVLNRAVWKNKWQSLEPRQPIGLHPCFTSLRLIIKRLSVGVHPPLGALLLQVFVPHIDQMSRCYLFLIF